MSDESTKEREELARALEVPDLEPRVRDRVLRSGRAAYARASEEATAERAWGARVGAPLASLVVGTRRAWSGLAWHERVVPVSLALAGAFYGLDTLARCVAIFAS